MPFYDRACPQCSWKAIDVFEPIAAPAAVCPDCGHITDRVWITKPPNVNGDEIWYTQVNGFATPREFRSKSERRRALKEAGWREADSHVPVQGSDKSPFTRRWESGGTAWLAAAEDLIKRHHNGEFAGSTPEPPDAPWNIR